MRALRLAGRARRVDHRGAGGAGGLAGSASAGGVSGCAVTNSSHATHPAGASPPKTRTLAHLRELIAHRRDHRRLFGVDQHDGGVGVVDHVLHLGGVEPVRDRDRGEADLAGRVQRRDDLERVGPAPRDAITAGRTQREQRVRELVGDDLELRVRRRRRSGAARGVDDHRRLGADRAGVLRQKVHGRVGSLPSCPRHFRRARTRPKCPW